MRKGKVKCSGKYFLFVSVIGGAKGAFFDIIYFVL